MKKIGQLILCLVLAFAMVFGVAACGGTGDTPGGDDNQGGNETPGGDDTPGGDTEPEKLTQQQILESVIGEMLNNENMTFSISVSIPEFPTALPVADLKLVKTQKAFNLEVLVMNESQMFFSDGYTYTPAYETTPGGTEPDEPVFIGYDVKQVVASGIGLSMTATDEQISAAATAVLDTLGKTFELELAQDETSKEYTLAATADFTAIVNEYVEMFNDGIKAEDLTFLQEILEQAGLTEDVIMKIGDVLTKYAEDVNLHEAYLTVDKVAAELALVADENGKFGSLSGALDLDIKNVPSIKVVGNTTEFDYDSVTGKYGLTLGVTAGNTKITLPTEDLIYTGDNYYYVELPANDSDEEFPPVELRFNTTADATDSLWECRITGVDNIYKEVMEDMQEELTECEADNVTSVFTASEDFYDLVSMFDFVIIDIFDASNPDSYPFATLYVTSDKTIALTKDFTIKFDPENPDPTPDPEPGTEVMSNMAAFVQKDTDGSYFIQVGFFEKGLPAQTEAYFVKGGQYTTVTLSIKGEYVYRLALDADMVDVIVVPGEATEKYALKADYLMVVLDSTEYLILNNVDAAVSDGIMSVKEVSNPDYDPDDPNSSETITRYEILKTLAQALEVLTSATPAPATLSFAV